MASTACSHSIDSQDESLASEACCRACSNSTILYRNQTLPLPAEVRRAVYDFYFDIGEDWNPRDPAMEPIWCCMHKGGCPSNTHHIIQATNTTTAEKIYTCYSRHRKTSKVIRPPTPSRLPMLCVNKLTHYEAIPVLYTNNLVFRDCASLDGFHQRIPTYIGHLTEITLAVKTQN